MKPASLFSLEKLLLANLAYRFDRLIFYEARAPFILVLYETLLNRLKKPKTDPKA